MYSKTKIAIIGGGTAALMLAAELDNGLFDIHIYEKGGSLGKKFLVAGKGGFNLTHAESPATFIEKYDPSKFIKPFFNHFNNQDLRKWYKDIDIPTLIGSSNKIYPIKGITPNQVLKAIINKINNNRVNIHLKHEWIKFSKDFNPTFKIGNENETVKVDIVILALGGASWKVTGSDGKWLNILKENGVETKEFEASNCAFKVNWEKDFLNKNEGKPLKNIATKINDKYIKGELVITQFGLEGGAIYAQSGQIRKQLKQTETAKLLLDLKPEFTEKEILEKLNLSSKSISKYLRDKIKIDNLKLALLKENTSKEEYLNLEKIVRKIKNLPISISGIAPINEAISTVGGISLNAIDQNLKINILPNHYAIGEMLDWDAPTGGYLLQASFSMGNYLAHHLNERYR